MPPSPDSPKPSPGPSSSAASTPGQAEPSVAGTPTTFSARPAAKPRRTTDWTSLPPSGGPLHAVDGIQGVSRVRPVTLLRTGHISERRYPAPPPPGHDAPNRDAEHLNQVAQVLAQAQSTLGSEEAALAWLRSPQTALAGATPLSMMGSDAGLAQVLRALSAAGAHPGAGKFL